MKFEWDEEKAALNEINHEVSFEEASTVFDDDFFLIFQDNLHSATEDRLLIAGQSEQNRVLLVVYTERRNKTRIISAREATLKEKRIYEKEKREALGK